MLSAFAKIVFCLSFLRISRRLFGARKVEMQKLASLLLLSIVQIISGSNKQGRRSVKSNEGINDQTNNL